MHVWIDGASLVGPVTGIQRVVDALLRAMPGVAPDVEMRAFRFPDDGPPRSGLPVSWHQAPGRRRWMRILRRGHLAPPLELLLRDRKGVFFFPDLTVLPTTPRSRSVVAIYDLSAFSVPELMAADFGRWFRREVSFSVNAADRIMTISRFAADEIEARFPQTRGRVDIVSPAADPHFRPSTPDALDAFRSARGLERPFLLWVGSIEPRKNLVGVLRAWARTHAQLKKDARLVIAGATRDASAEIMNALSAAGGDVIQLGYVPDAELPLLYGAARALVFPSFYEGFGLPPLEAMACGTPVLTSQAASLPEVVGDAALLVDPRDVDAIAAAMTRLLEDDELHARLCVAGLARAAVFDWATSARKLADVFRSLSAP